MKLGVFFGITLLVASATAYNNGMGARPPMGWNTWCTADICGLRDICTDSEIRSVAKSIIAQGMDKLGYEFVNMDDCWSSTNRTATGELQPDPKNFPNGMKAVADYVHSLGLKIGVYTCIGTLTCKRGRPGSFGHYDQDAKTLAGWGIDFVKTDNCHHPPGGYATEDLYRNFSRALNATGRPMLFSLCEWGNDNVNSWGAEVAQMFRIQQDHLPFWHFPAKAAGAGLGQGTGDIIEFAALIKPSTFVKQYGWMDPDFLMTMFPVTMDFTSSRTEFSFWSLWSAPLLVSTDVRDLAAHPERQQIVLNAEVIAIDQDPLWTAGDRVYNHTDGAQVWYKPLFGGDVAVILYNSNTVNTVSVTVTFDMVGWTSSTVATARDLWAHTNLGPLTGTYTAKVGPRDVIMLRMKKQG